MRDWRWLDRLPSQLACTVLPGPSIRTHQAGRCKRVRTYGTPYGGLTSFVLHTCCTRTCDTAGYLDTAGYWILDTWIHVAALVTDKIPRTPSAMVISSIWDSSSASRAPPHPTPPLLGCPSWSTRPPLVLPTRSSPFPPARPPSESSVLWISWDISLEQCWNPVGPKGRSVPFLFHQSIPKD